MSETPASHTDDLELARAIIADDEDAWHRFVTERSGVIIAVLRRYIFDDDDVRTVYVDLLASLRRGRLADFAGFSSLTTWLVCLARGAAADHLRHTLGRRQEPAGLESLDAVQREAFRLYHVEGLAYDDVLLRLRQAGLLDRETSLAEILAAIENRLTARTLRRVAWDLHAASVGAASGRLLQYLDAAARDAEDRASRANPESELIAREARRTLERVHELVDQLPEEERRVLTLRFDAGWTADEVAAELGLPDRRRVYTIADRALARLRRWLHVTILVAIIVLT